MFLAMNEKMQGFKETGIYDINKICLFGKSVQDAFRLKPPEEMRMMGGWGVWGWVGVLSPFAAF